MKTFAYFLASATMALSTARADDKIIVHEWGTFTCLQDEQGQAIGGINVDDEPVPGFVFGDGCQPVAAQYSRDLGNFGLPPYAAGKGWAPGDPAVTMRLETPVIYIYPPKGRSPDSVPPLHVHVDFHGGMLTQFYPYADAIPFNGNAQLSPQLVSSLDWANVRLGSTTTPVETDDKVWTTPREVSAPMLGVTMHWRGGNGQPDPVGVPQAEHFLFYRGVGHLDSPIGLTRNDRDEFGDIYPQFFTGWHGPGDLSEILKNPVQSWVIEISKEGSCAFRKTDLRTQIGMIGIFTMGKINAAFSASDFSAAKLTELKASMHDALVKEGLYDDEATAMLKTWELSYFKSPGLRFFYLVPRPWVDKVLPLSVTGAPTAITRVMVGRIELITDAQKAALQRLSDGPCPDLQSVKKAAQLALQDSKLPKAEVDRYYRGEKSLADLGIAIPPLIRDYLSLGRFRDALVMQKFWQQKSMPLAQFINENKIAPEGVEVKGRDLVPLPPDVSLKNPGTPSSTQLHL